MENKDFGLNKKFDELLVAANDLIVWKVMAKNEHLLILFSMLIGILISVSQLMVPFGRQVSYVPILIALTIYFLSAGALYWHGYVRFLAHFKDNATPDEQHRIEVTTDYLFWFLLVGISMAKICILIFLVNKYI